MKINNRLLIKLVALSLLNFFIMIFFGIDSNLRFIPLALTLILSLMCREDEILPFIFFIRPNFGLYDNIGFKYLFNVIILISAIKLLLLKNKRKNLDKKSLFLIVLLFLYNIILTLLNNINFSYLLTYVSLFFSYIILIIYSKNKFIDFKNIYLYYSTGMIMSFLCGILIPISMYGFNFPNGYRFCALMRDSNGYSLELLFLIITAPLYSKLSNKNSTIYVLIFTLFGFMGISKMFLICIVFVFLYNILFSNKNIVKGKIDMKKIFISIILLGLLIYLNNKFDFISLFKNNYLLRFSNTDLTSGRSKIFSYYLNLLFNDPITLIFGRSLAYYQIIGFDGWAMVHNTWMEIVLSFGVLGTIIYFVFLKEVIKYPYEVKNKSKNKEFILLLILFMFCLNSLPILSGDALAILILYAIIIKNINYYNRGEKLEEKD